MSTIANTEETTVVVKVKKIFKLIDFFYLTPLDMYHGLSQVY